MSNPWSFCVTSTNLTSGAGSPGFPPDRLRELLFPIFQRRTSHKFRCSLRSPFLYGTKFFPFNAAPTKASTS